MTFQILLRIRVIFADVILSSQKPFSTEVGGIDNQITKTIAKKKKKSSVILPQENKREDEKEEARATELVEAEPFADADVQVSVDSIVYRLTIMTVKDDTFQTPTKQTPLDSESPINTEATVGTSTIAVQEKRRPVYFLIPTAHIPYLSCRLSRHRTSEPHGRRRGHSSALRLLWLPVTFQMFAERKNLITLKLICGTFMKVILFFSSADPPLPYTWAKPC